VQSLKVFRREQEGPKPKKGQLTLVLARRWLKLLFQQFYPDVFPDYSALDAAYELDEGGTDTSSSDTEDDDNVAE